MEDYRNVIEIMKRLEIKKLIISRDNRFSKLDKEHDKEQYSLTDKATGDLTAMLKENGMTAEIASFGPDLNLKMLDTS